MTQLTDSQLTSQVYKRRSQINALQKQLPELYVNRREAKQAFRSAVNLYAMDNLAANAFGVIKPMFHEVYVAAQKAAEIDRQLQVTLTLLKELTELQTAQKREIKQRVNARQNRKRDIIDAYLKQQKRYAERGQVNPKEQGVSQLKVA